MGVNGFWGTSFFLATEAAEEQATDDAGPTAQQITAIKAAIQNAQTLQEVAELEKALVTGNVPSQFRVSMCPTDISEPTQSSCYKCIDQILHPRLWYLDTHICCSPRAIWLNFNLVNSGTRRSCWKQVLY